MPNWCECDLTMMGKESDIVEFERVAKGTGEIPKEKDAIVIQAEQFVPFPKARDVLTCSKCGATRKETKEESEDKAPLTIPKCNVKGCDGYMKDWFNTWGYDWCIKNWGTKWGICDAHVVEKKNGYRKYYFESAWSPPIPVIQAISKRFPGLKIEMQYYEQGVGFSGDVHLQSGEIIKSEENDHYEGDRGG